MRFLALLFCLVLGACSTTSTVRQAPEVVAGRTYALAFVNEGGDDVEGIAALERAIRSRLDAAGLLGESGDATRLEVTLTHYYVRSNGARFWAGIMAGRDKIISRVRIVGADGRQAGSFDVESTNSTAWGTTDGLHEKHAEEIVASLQRQE